MVGEESISLEVRRAGLAGLPFLSLSITLLFIFTITTSLKSDPVRSKPWEAMAGVLCPMLGLGTAFGSLLWVGYEYNALVSVAPFLVLAVGVDDAFLTLHTWHRTEKSLPVEQRLALTLAGTGPSITITSLTNALSFGIGAFSRTPAIRYFCTYTSVAIAVEYMFQVFFFSAVVAIGGRREAQNRNAYCPSCIGVKKDKTKNHISARFDDFLKHFYETWTAAAISWKARGFVLALLVTYWSIAVYGIWQMKVELSPEKLFLHDSPLQKWLEVQSNVLFKEGNKLYIFVNKPGSLSDESRLGEINTLVHRFEKMPDSLGQDSTAFWLRDFSDFQSFMASSQISGFRYDLIPNFLNSTSYSRWDNYLSLDGAQCALNSPKCLKSFVFTTDFANGSRYVDRLVVMQGYRKLALEFQELNVTVYEDFAMFSDQTSTLADATKINLSIALVCMTIVCAIFIPNIPSIVVATLSVLSINLGVFGFLMLWNVDLDTISQTTILMSVGFSVDFTAHVSYHYFKGVHTGVHSRLYHTLASVAWPTLQAGLSTFLAVGVLFIVDAYLCRVFVKTIVLVVAFGFIHGLVILPVLLTSLPFQKIQVTKGKI